MRENVIVLDLNRATVKADIGRLPDRMHEAALEILRDRAYYMKGLWQIYSRVETGWHRDSIRVERVTRGPYIDLFRVRAGGYVVNPKTGRLVDYAVYLEERYHAGARAYRQAKEDIQAMLTSKVVEVVSH